jgi:uncharacterized membrane protein
MIELFLIFLISWYAFAMSVSVYRQWLLGKLSLFNKLVFLIPLLSFVILDILCNYTIMLVFGFPPKGCYTISSRLEYYSNNSDGIRQKLSIVVCKALSELDASGRHC